MGKQQKYMSYPAFKIRKYWEGSEVWKKEKDWEAVWDLSSCRQGVPLAAEMFGSSPGCADRMVAAALC